MTGQEFLDKIKDQLACDLLANKTIKAFTTNSDLIGAFAEATVRQLVHRMVAPLRVSRGTIIYEGNCSQPTPEIDAIIWAPCPLPALFEIGEFAVVPRHSAFAFLEIKRSNYKRSGGRIRQVLSKERELLPYRLKDQEGRDVPQALAVICLLMRENRDPDVDQLIKENNAVALVKEEEDGTLTPDGNAIYTLVNFLAQVRSFAKLIDGSLNIVYPPQPLSGQVAPLTTAQQVPLGVQRP